MKIKEKLKITGRRSHISMILIIVVMLYFSMLLLKTMYIETNESSILLVQNIHNEIGRIISLTLYLPIEWLWNWIPYTSVRTNDLLEFYKPIIPGFIIITICGLFIHDHQALKQKFKKFKTDIEDEIIRRQMKKEAGLVNSPDPVTVDVLIENKTNNDPSWHETWWGKLIIGVAIALIVAAFGIS